MGKINGHKSFLGLVSWLVVCFAAAAIGAVASVHAASFYMQLVRPGWAPPPALFGPVWTVLYAMMGFSAWLVWRIDGFDFARKALSLFLVQLAVNALWSWVFFVWHLGLAAFANIILLWVLIILSVQAFWRIQKLAAVLLLPYLAWVSFAMLLSFSIWQANPLRLG